MIDKISPIQFEDQWEYPEPHNFFNRIKYKKENVLGIGDGKPVFFDLTLRYDEKVDEFYMHQIRHLENQLAKEFEYYD